MKGQSKVTEVIFFIGLVVLLLQLIFIYPKLWKELIDSVIHTSPLIVVRDIAGLITVSGAAPDTIKIFYKVPTDKYSYNLNVDKRTVKLQMLDENGKPIGSEAITQIPIDPTVSLQNKISFIIEKTRIAGRNFYEVKS